MVSDELEVIGCLLRVLFPYNVFMQCSVFPGLTFFFFFAKFIVTKDKVQKTRA